MRYVGWDWASRTHDVTVLEDSGAVVERWSFAHTEAGWAATLHRLRRHGDPDQLPVIIEKSSGLVVDRLLGAGHPVIPVHPTAFYAARPRWGAAGAKSDPGDSYKLADYLRTDGHRLRRLEPADAGAARAAGAGAAARRPGAHAHRHDQPAHRHCSRRTGPGRVICSRRWAPRSPWRS